MITIKDQIQAEWVRTPHFRIFLSPIVQEALVNIVQPTADAMVKEGRPFKGVLYAGLILTPNGVKTIEFNARFGDPETQVILPRLKTDLLDIFLAINNGTLAEQPIEWSEQAAVCVIVASPGYPGPYPKGLADYWIWIKCRIR